MVYPLKKFNMSPLCTQRGRHVGLPLCYLLCLSQSVCLCYPFIFVQRFLSCPLSNTRRWPKAGLMLAHYLRRWPNSCPVLGYGVVFGATLNVGQRHRRPANINPAFVQSTVPASMKYWLWLNGYWPAPATLAQQLTDIGSVSECTI